MQKKIIYIILIMILIISFLIFINYNHEQQVNTQTGTNDKICIDVLDDLKNQKDVIIYFKAVEEIKESLDITNKLEKKYQNLSIHIFKNEQREENCIKKILNENSLSNELDDSSSLIIYKQGQYQGFMISPSDINQIEDYLSQLQVITKQEVSEKINLNQFQENIKSEKYFLLIVADEEARTFYEEEFAKQMVEYKYDIINLNTTEGKKILNYVDQNFEKIREFPQIYYFNNNKLKLTETIYDSNSLAQFQENIK